eukprot:CAMPEP_0173300878 /NCGR_PEP_ID=MMETSP1143-20121109/17470_1 /TAXON_ID=483371 /ORGANISM="non described non described, Strain CCMP2298" /LENGTH=438 /DNA_ID=CAMNT_0014241309 /DNA_START=136 /DNA_END=1448 /DNA_ORIENTATION=+
MGWFGVARVLVVLLAAAWTIAVRLPHQSARSRQLSSSRLSAIPATPDTLSSGEKSIFIFGLGYVGLEVARQLKEGGWRVMGTCTNVNKAVQLQEQGITTHLFDEMTNTNAPSDALDDIMSATHVLSTIPPSTDVDFDLVLGGYGDALRKSAMRGNLRWMGYLSSTGVYGECGGAWVNESEPPRPFNAKTQARAKAERQWRFLWERNGLPVHIFRLAGIYGPGRSALETLRKAEGDLTRCGASDSVCTSRIHVADIVSCLQASMRLPAPGEIYNVADDLPSTRYEVLTYACRLLGYPIQRPLITGVEEGASTRGGSKRVDNTKVQALLQAAGLRLQYPDYRAGLHDLLKLEPGAPVEVREQGSAEAIPYSGDIRTDASEAAAYAASAKADQALSETDDVRRQLAGLQERVASLEKSEKGIREVLIKFIVDNKKAKGVDA